MAESSIEPGVFAGIRLCSYWFWRNFAITVSANILLPRVLWECPLWAIQCYHKCWKLFTGQKRVISLFRKNAQETVHRLSMVNEQLTAYFSLCEHLGFSLDLVVSNAEVFWNLWWMSCPPAELCSMQVRSVRIQFDHHQVCVVWCKLLWR